MLPLFQIIQKYNFGFVLLMSYALSNGWLWISEICLLHVGLDRQWHSSEISAGHGASGRSVSAWRWARRWPQLEERTCRHCPGQFPTTSTHQKASRQLQPHQLQMLSHPSALRARTTACYFYVGLYFKRNIIFLFPHPYTPPPRMRPAKFDFAPVRAAEGPDRDAQACIATHMHAQHPSRVPQI